MFWYMLMYMLINVVVYVAIWLKDFTKTLKVERNKICTAEETIDSKSVMVLQHIRVKKGWKAIKRRSDEMTVWEAHCRRKNLYDVILCYLLFQEVILCYLHEDCKNFRCGRPPVTGSYFIPAWWCVIFASLTTCSIRILLVPLCPGYEWFFVHLGC